MRNCVKRTPKNRRRYLSPTSLVVAMVVIAIGTVTVASRQKVSSSNQNKSSREVTTNVASSRVVPQNAALIQGGQRDRTPDETARLAEGLSQVIDQSTEGLMEIHHTDGSASINLEDRFQSVSVARIDQRGNLAQSCVDNPQAAGAFFRINPELIQSQRRATRPNNQE